MMLSFNVRSGRCLWLILPILLVFWSYGRSQVSEAWVAHYDGGGQGIYADYARDMVMDQQGNIYVVGTSVGPTDADIVTVSFDPEGGERWATRFDGEDGLNDWGYSIAMDSSGDLYVCGSSQFTGSGKDFVIIKYDNSGNQIWARYYNGPADRDDEAVQVEVDCEGNVAATGSSQGSDAVSDYATVMFDSQGDSLWSARYNGPGNNVDEARALAVDCDGNVYISGGSIGDSTDFDYTTIKYDHDGNQLWAARYDGPIHGYDVVYYAGSVLLDSVGNVYVTGYSAGEDSSYDYMTIKYDSSGNPAWSHRYSGSQGDDYADAIYLDDSGNLYVTGASYDSISNYDYLTIKYDRYGTILWTSRYNGTGNDWDEAYGISVDDLGNVYVVGRSIGDGTMADFATLKYSPSGEELWSIRYDGSAHNFEWPFRILLDGESNVYVAGTSFETGNGSDYTVIKYEQSQSGTENDDHPPNPVASLIGNYPNPFNSRTEIRYYLAAASRVRIEIYDILGRRISTLVDSEQQPGSHDVIWDSGGESSGIYFYNLKTDRSSSTKSMILLK